MPISPATHESIARAARILNAGGVVAFPTETVYGLGADATNAGAVLRVFEIKGRPRFNPLIAHVAGREAAETHATFNATARKLADRFWPGPLTLVLPKRSESTICDLVSSGLDTIAVRVPSNPVAQELLQAAGCPVAAPSANRAGRVSPTLASHVADDLGDKVELVLDAGQTALGLESTIVDTRGSVPVLLRSGAIPRQEIEDAVGIPLGDVAAIGRPSSPGQLESHYAPHAKLRLGAIEAKPGEALLAFGPGAPQADGPFVNLSESGDLREAAMNLFAALRELDASGCGTIAVMPIPEDGLGEAINDRLRHAAAPRSG